jgi:hypothetical protein
MFMHSIRVGKLVALSSLTAVSLTLAACGGGGGTNSTPTPPPTPAPSPAPTSISGKPTVNSNFTAEANVSNVDYEAGLARTASGGTVTAASLAYDARSDSFSLKTASDEISFGPSDVSVNAANVLRYEKSKDSTTTRLDLNWRLNSDGTRASDYVEIGQLISIKEDALAGIDSYCSIDFVFGLPSMASAVPGSGGASYSLSFSGTRSSTVEDALLRMAGRGAALIDFKTGRIEVLGNTNSQNFIDGGMLLSESEGEVNANGVISSGENRFTGSFTAKAGASDTYTGNFTGSFYGPKAQSIGGVLYGTSNSQFYSLAFAGYNLPVTHPDDTLAKLMGVTSLQTVQMFPRFDRDGVTNSLGSIGDFSYVTYNADTQTYTVPGFSISPANRTPDKDAGDLRAYSATQTNNDGKMQYSIGMFDGDSKGIQLTYASFIRALASQVDPDGSTKDVGLEYIGFGRFTPPNQLPRSGSALYAGRLFGDIYDNSKLLAPLIGRSDLSVDFAAGTMDASLSPERVNPDGSSTALGKYDFKGSIETFLAAFDGTWNAGEGHLVGRFYGDAAQEYVATFNIHDPVQGRMTGISVGKR